MHPFRLPSKHNIHLPHNNAARQAGISLIESLISLSVIGILALSAVSYGGQYAINLSIESELTALQQHIAYARSEARTLDTKVRLCQSDDGKNCTLGPDWAKGWIAYSDTAGGWSRDSTNDTILYVHKVTDSRITIAFCNRWDSVLINDDGRLRTNGSFEIRSVETSGSHYKALVLTAQDNTRIEERKYVTSKRSC